MKPPLPVPTRVKILVVKDEHGTFLGSERPQTERSIPTQKLQAFFPVLVLSILMSQHLSATVLISTASTDGVLLGSDGLGIRKNVEGRVIGRLESCKIRQVGKIVVGHAGVVEVPDAGFDFWETVGSIVASDATQFAESLSNELEDRLKDIASRRRFANPSTPGYEEITIGVYIVEWQPEINLIELSAGLGMDGSPTVSRVSITEGIRTPKAQIVNYLGVFDAAANFFQANPFRFADSEVIRGITLVQISF